MGCRGCLTLLAALLVIVAVLLGGTHYLLTRPSPLVAGMSTIAPSREASAEFDRKLSVFFTELGTEDSYEETPTTTLVVTEEEATSKLAEFVQNSQMPIDVEGLQVHFRNDRVQVSGSIRLRGVAINVALQSQVVSRDGKPEVVVDRVNVGQIDVPDSIRRRVLASISAGTGSVRLEGLPVDVGTIGVVDGRLVIEGIKLP